LSQRAEAHYRWSEKTNESLANIPAVQAAITAMLRSWARLDLTG